MGKKILLADDSITIQKVIELTFSDEDFDVVTVGNGRLALERLPEVRPDIVLCDIIMPEKDGYEVCEQIKSSPSWSHLPVLLLTGAFEPFDQDRASRAGYDGSLAKPFEPETLIAKVKELLARAPRPAPARPAAVETTAPAPSFVAPPPTLTGAVLSAHAPAAPLASGFIPEEPFSGFDDAFAGSAPAADAQSLAGAEPLAEISEEESDALAPPPFEQATEDSVSTVMFRASDLPWAATPLPPAAAPSRPAEPLFVPDSPIAAEPPRIEAAEQPAEEPAVFEAVLEEDLEFGSPEYAANGEALPQAVDEEVAPSFEEAGEAAEMDGEDAVFAAGDDAIFAPELTARSPASGVEEGASGAFAALVRDQLPEAAEVTDTASFLDPAAPAEDRPASELHHDVEEQSVPEAPSLEGGVDQEGPQPDADELFEEEGLPAAAAPELTPAEPAPLDATQAATFEAAEEATFEEEPPFEVAWPDEPISEEEPVGSAELEPEEPQLAYAAEAAPTQASAGEPFDSLADAPRAEDSPSDGNQAQAAADAPQAETVSNELPRELPAAAVAASVAAPAPAAAEEESFGDLAEAVASSEPQPPASEAAALAVPVEMVEKIAQRVVAQISEKAVREIAWEVIPDLAEALIKQEIEKLKAELAKL